MSSVKTRIKQKNDSTANWNTANAGGFKPLQGEIIVYNDVNRIKIGDGSNTVSNVPFLDANCVHLTDNETINGYKKFENPITIKDSISNSDIMLGATNAANNPGMAGEITWHDGEGNDGAVYIPQGQSDTLATMYKKYTRFTAFAVGDNLSGKTLLFNTEATYSRYFGLGRTIVTSSGGYTISIAGGPPTVSLLKNDTVVQTFADWAYRPPDGTMGTVWTMSSYTLPSDFGTVSTLNTESGGTTYTSIWNTFGLDGATAEYDLMNVKEVYHRIPKIVDNLTTTSAYAALSAQQGYTLNNNKAPKASPTFTGTVTFGNDTPLSVNSSVGTAGQVLTSQGTGKSPKWANVPTPSNMVTIDTAQSISSSKTFTDTINFKGQSADTYLFDCYADDGQSDTIVGAFLNTIDSTNGESKGELKLGDGNAECAISLKNSYGTSGQVLTSQGSGKTPIWQTPSKELYYINGSTVSITNMTKDGIYVWTPGNVSTATFKYAPSNNIGFTITPPNGCVIYIFVTKRKDTSTHYTLCWRFYLGEVLYHGEARINTSTGAVNASLAYKLEKNINQSDYISSDSTVTLFQAKIGGTISWYGDCDIYGDITFTLLDNKTTPTQAAVTISNYSQGDPIFVNITRNGGYTLMEITTDGGVQRAILNSSYAYESLLKITSPATGDSFTFNAYMSYEKGGHVS